ncbi:MAG TPA: WD40 repeat domain-containing protein [Candidatus Thermoplasmatota archaeon]|nr:WD40 repeat domain-containing protein [Candidatus Thermoplasmatota archaeon]
MRRALVLALAVLVVPVVSAAPPQKAGDVTAPAPTTDLAVADAAPIAALSLAVVDPPTTPVTADVVAINLTANGTALWTNTYTGRAPGKHMVAVSRDGGAIVSGQREAPGPNAPPTFRNLQYYDTDAPLTPSQVPGPTAPPPAMTPKWAKKLPGAVQVVTVSGDGGAVVSGELGGDGKSTVRAFTGAGADRFSLFATGSVVDLAVSEDGSRAAYGGATLGADGATEIAYVDVLALSSGSRASHRFESEPVRSVAITRDGSQVLAGTEDGRLTLFRPSGTDLGSPVTSVDLGLGAINDVVFARGGSTAVVGGDKGFAVLVLDSGGYRQSYNATLASPVRTVDVTADGTYVLVVSTDAYGYLAERNQQLWVLTGPFNDGGMDDDARRLVLLRGAVAEAYTFSRAAFFRHVTPQGVVDTVAPRAPDGDGIVRFPTVVVSNGSAFDTIEITLPESPGVVFSANRTRIDMPPGGTVQVGIEAMPSGLPPGTHRFQATARSLLGGGSVNLSLDIDVASRGGFLVSLQGLAGDRILPRGGSDTAVFVVRNSGNVRVEATVRVTQAQSAGAPWTLDVDPSTVSVPGGATSSVQVRVTPPPSAANGTTNRITFVAQSDVGSAVQAVNYVLSPNLGVHLDTPSRVKFVGPTQSAWFNLSVVNTGSVRTAYEIAYETLSQKGAGWNVDVDVSQFNLTAGATRTIPLRIFAPGVGTATDRITLFVEVKTIEKLPGNRYKPVAAENLTLIANLNPELAPKRPDFVPDDGIFQIPSVSTLAALAAFAAASVGISRRRRA